MQLELMRLRRRIDSRIEPHPFRESEFELSNPIVNEIIKYGQEINISKAWQISFKPYRFFRQGSRSFKAKSHHFFCGEAITRKGIEEFIDAKVFLGHRIKVSKDWRDDPQQLRRFGYEL